MHLLRRTARRVRMRTLVGLALVPGLPVVTAFFVPADAIGCGVVASALWIVLLARDDVTPRRMRHVLLAAGAAMAVAWVIAFLLVDWR